MEKEARKSVDALPVQCVVWKPHTRPYPLAPRQVPIEEEVEDPKPEVEEGAEEAKTAEEAEAKKEAKEGDEIEVEGAGALGMLCMLCMLWCASPAAGQQEAAHAAAWQGPGERRSAGCPAAEPALCMGAALNRCSADC